MAESKKTTPKKPVKKKASQRGLGRGLSALMADVSVPPPEPDTAPAKPAAPVKTQVETPDPASRNVQFIAISRLDRNPDQPRKMFREKDMEELTESIRRKGVLQPILVRPIPKSNRSDGDPDYQIVAGERRWQASLRAGLDAMPVLIRDLSDQEVLEIGVVENVQRADLNPIEEARAYKALMDDFGRTQADVSEAVGKSRSHIANLVRLLDLPTQVRRYLELGRITPGHAKAIAGLPDPTAMADYIIRDGISVRGAEAMVKRYREGAPVKTNANLAYDDDPNLRKIERDISDMIGLDVKLKHRGPGGEVRIKYQTGDQLEHLMKRLKH